MNNRAMVRALKGAPLSVLTLMLWSRHEHPPAWEVAELAAGTDYKREAITEARAVLVAMGLCEPAERGRMGLRLCDLSVEQMGLFDLLPPGPIYDAPRSEIGKTDLTLSSSSSSLEYRSASFPITTTTTTTTTEKVRSEKPISLCHPATAELEQWFVSVIGCPSRHIAAEAVAAALSEDAEPLDIKIEALWWWVYCANGSAPSIPRERWGFLIARKIQSGEYVYPGYTYNERAVKAIDQDLYNEFLEVRHVWETRNNAEEAPP